MNILPLKTLPQRSIEILNNTIFWPMKTARVSRQDYKNARNKGGFVPRTILFYPEAPKTFHALYKIVAYLGWDVTTNPKKSADVRIYFEDKTYRKRNKTIERLCEKYHVINANSTDISKQHVDDVFHEVFGYSMSLDPKTYKGECVKKSNTNAVHDGKVITCPTHPEDGYVYQRYIDSIQPDGRAMDLRLHIFYEKISFSLKRYKNKDDLFNVTVAAEFVDTDEILNSDEQEKVIEFCKRMGLDYGELDAMRDNNDGRLYIVDVNNTPAGPIGPFYEKGLDLERWFKEMALHTEREFLKK